MAGKLATRGKSLRAVLIALSAIALGALPAPAGAQSNDKPSFFKRLWSGIADAASDDSNDNDPVSQNLTPPPESASQPLVPPSLSTARWVGFTPAIAVSAAQSEAERPGMGAGAWIAGPFPEAGAIGWASDTVSGLTVQVQLVWREARPGSLALLSAEAAAGLGLLPGAIANIAIYVDR